MKRSRAVTVFMVAGFALVAIGIALFARIAWQLLFRCPPDACASVVEQTLATAVWTAGPTTTLGVILLAAAYIVNEFRKAHLRDEESSSE